jgi:hypothetical protein
MFDRNIEAFVQTPQARAAGGKRGFDMPNEDVETARSGLVSTYEAISVL